ncbi:MAG: c-type cytochrome [Limisphaerales bacterium]
MAEQFPPRNDIAQAFVWDLTLHAGKKGYLEIVDGNGGQSYAWLAVGRFDPPVVPLPRLIPNQVDKRQQSAAEMAETLHLAKLESPLTSLLMSDDADVETRSACAKALLSINPSAHISDFGKIVFNAEEPIKLREKSAEALAQINFPEAKNILIAAFQNAPQNLQRQIVLALAGHAEGAETLLQAVTDGKISARFLQETSIKDRLLAAKLPNSPERLDKLTRGLTPLDVRRQKIIEKRRAAFNSAETSGEPGAKIFAQSCAVCHQLDGQGALVGPQLDGVGARGADRLIEDILDPNRNVDRAFRTSLIVLKDGEVQSGLFRREEGETVVLAQSTGKEISIPKKEIQEQRESETSLMPENFSDIITAEDFNNLIAFLLSKGSKPASNK